MPAVATISVKKTDWNWCAWIIWTRRPFGDARKITICHFWSASAYVTFVALAFHMIGIGFQTLAIPNSFAVFVAIRPFAPRTPPQKCCEIEKNIQLSKIFWNLWYISELTVTSWHFACVIFDAVSFAIVSIQIVGDGQTHSRSVSHSDTARYWARWPVTPTSPFTCPNSNRIPLEPTWCQLTRQTNYLCMDAYYTLLPFYRCHRNWISLFRRISCGIVGRRRIQLSTHSMCSNRSNRNRRFRHRCVGTSRLCDTCASLLSPAAP